MRILGLDVGTKRIGIAVSDPSEKISLSVATLIRKDSQRDLDIIGKVIDEYDVKRIVVGLPLNMDGSLGKQAQGVLDWIKPLKARFDIPVETSDERLTSVQGQRILLEADISRKKRKEVTDKLAAQIILQGYLDSKRQKTDV